MNKHLTDGQLRAALDSELSQEDQLHLDACAECQRSLESVRATVQQASRGLAFLMPAGSERVPAAGPALAHFHQQTLLKKETSMFQKIFASRALRYASAVVVILALAMAVPATRAMASQLLSLFRVQQVTVIPIDLTGMQQLTGNNIYGKQISQLISSSTTVTQKPGEPVAVTSAAQASQVTGFAVRLPAGMTPAEMYVEGGAAFSFKVDRARAQALLDEAGRKDLVLPASIDGADIAVKIPASLSVGYGNCPKPSGDEPGVAIDMNGAVRSHYTDCVLLAEIPSPVVSAPADVNISQLAQIALQFTGMTREQAAQFAQTVDWTSSLVIPIPKNAATYENVTVDGVTGTLIARDPGDSPQYALVWVKNGVIYAIGGLGSDTAKAIQMANSLQ